MFTFLDLIIWPYPSLVPLFSSQIVPVWFPKNVPVCFPFWNSKIYNIIILYKKNKVFNRKKETSLSIRLCIVVTKSGGDISYNDPTILNKPSKYEGRTKH